MDEEKVQSPRILQEINKQIIEIKKKIQLSEGQRKAAFEEYETERKQNADQILKLKKEIKELTIELQKNKDETAIHRVRNSRLETVVGPLVNKTTDQVQHSLDLHIIDRKKQLDLIRHRIKQQKTSLENLAEQYKILLCQQTDQEIVTKLANTLKKSPKKCKTKSGEKQNKIGDRLPMVIPYKKQYYEIQNKIHRIEVQWKEAEHIKNSYKTIRSTLLKDRGCFESSLRQLEERKQTQDKDIQELQKMTTEAASTRSMARLTLEREERSSAISGRIRERQSAEQLALVSAQRTELERLERRIFTSSKGAGDGPGAVTAAVKLDEEAEEKTEESEEEVEDEEDKEENDVFEAFAKLKEITGATDTEEVLNKFQEQKNTRNRLEYLKKTTETEKQQLERQQEEMLSELEGYKYAQEKHKEKYSDDLLNLKENVEQQIRRNEKIEDTIKEKQTLLDTIWKSLYNLYLTLKGTETKPLEEISADPEQSRTFLKSFQEEVQNLIKKREELNLKEASITEDVDSTEEILPPSYNVLLRRTPLSGQGQPAIATSPTPEDEEDVPSRHFLKRQAQLVVDAKSRRKVIRIPMNRK